MAVNLVNVENVSKVYGTRALLDGVSLGVSEGDRIGVVGRNGDGKTTLIRMLAKLEDSTRRPPCGTRSSGTWPTMSGPATPRSAMC
jgi:ATPase subunit of ABC transporter with duplicated ATPase domains